MRRTFSRVRRTHLASLAVITGLLLSACGAAIEEPAGGAGQAQTGVPLATALPAATSTPLPEPTQEALSPTTEEPAEPSPAASEAALPDTSGGQAELPPMPDCQSELALTPANSEGPYFIPNSPERASLLEEGMAGTPLIVTGYVLTPDCQPVAGAKLDFWQADASGAYDNSGYRLRGHQLTDGAGLYRLETILPAEYPGRPPHIHVKVLLPGGTGLTTQLYFPDQASNAGDGIFRPDLVVDLQETEAGLVATFHFVVDG